MVDIVERLRGLPIIVSENGRTGISRVGGALLSEAADEIERLREALQRIGYGPPNEGEPLDLLNQFVDLARDALKEKE